MKKFKVDLSKLEGQRYEKLQYLLSEGLVDFQYIYKTGPTAGTIRYGRPMGCPKIIWVSHCEKQEKYSWI